MFPTRNVASLRGTSRYTRRNHSPSHGAAFARQQRCCSVPETPSSGTEHSFLGTHTIRKLIVTHQLVDAPLKCARWAPSIVEEEHAHSLTHFFQLPGQCNHH